MVGSPSQIRSVLAARPYNEASSEGQRPEHYFGLVPAGPRPWDCGSGCDGLPRSWDSDGNRVAIGRRDAEWLRLGIAAQMQRSENAEPGSVPAGRMRWAECSSDRSPT
jgi:hypothetical protein